MMKFIMALTFLFVTCNVALAQFTPSKENLRGLTGVRVMVMFGHCPTRDFKNCAEGLDASQRAEVLKMLEADTKAKLEKAGIPFSRSQFAEEIGKDYGRLIVLVTLDPPNGFVHPIETEVKLLQRVRLTRDPSIEFDAMTWSLDGVGNKLEIAIIRQQIAGEVDRFIEDYLSVNPKQSAAAPTLTLGCSGRWRVSHQAWCD